MRELCNRPAVPSVQHNKTLKWKCFAVHCLKDYKQLFLKHMILSLLKVNYYIVFFLQSNIEEFECPGPSLLRDKILALCRHSSIILSWLPCSWDVGRPKGSGLHSEAAGLDRGQLEAALHLSFGCTCEAHMGQADSQKAHRLTWSLQPLWTPLCS